MNEIGESSMNSGESFVQQSTSPNADGAAGERYAAAILTCALCAQAAHSSLQDDGKKLDLKVSLLNAFSAHKSVVSVHVQIKHGASFARRKPGIITLQNITADTISTLQEGSQPALLVWIPSITERESKIYWHIIRPKGKHRSPIKIDGSNYVTPSLRFELSRFANFERRNLRYPCLDIPPVIADPSMMGVAKKQYAILKKENLKNALIGNIKVTRLAWRHITRRSRAITRRQRSFHVLKYLEAFLEQVPSRYLVHRHSANTTDDMMLERNEIVFWYRHAFRIDGKGQTLLVRFIEETKFPINWAERPLSEDEVTHHVTLVSWWFKPEKESGASLVHSDARRLEPLAISKPSVTSSKSRGLIEAPQLHKKANSTEQSS